MKTDFSENDFPIYTNNLHVEINRKNIDSHFTIFQIGTQNLFFHENVLDISSDRFKAQSVAYYRSTRWFAMFKKNAVSLADFRTEVQSIDESAIVNEVDLFSTDFEAKNSIKDVELAQLLVNSLKNRNNDLFSYNNITGSLYYSFDTKESSKSFEFLKLRFYTPSEDSIALEANTETFSEYDTLKKFGKKAEQKYVFDDETGEFRRKLCDDYGKHCRFFDKGALTRKGSRRKFLDFASKDNFLKSKSGIIATFLTDVKENLNDYITISQIPLTKYNSYDEPRADYENKDYKSFLQKRVLCVVDTVKTEESAQMKNQIDDFLRKEYDVTDISDNREKGKYIIEIIHDKDTEYYASKEEAKNPSLFEDMNKPKDQHNLYTEEEIIQHITVENSATKIDSETIKDVMHNIVQELIIKGDLHDKKISLVNWNEQKEWKFVRCGKGKWNGQKRCYDFVYYKMIVTQSGELDLESFDAKAFPDSEEWEVFDNIFRFYNRDNKNQYSNIECIVYENISNINVIYQTKQFTMPNVEELAEKIAISDGKNKINKTELKNYLDEYIASHDMTVSQKSAFEIMYKNIEAEPSSEISYKAIRELKSDDGLTRRIKPKTISDFIQWLYDEKQILLHGQLKSGDNLYKNFNSMIGIKTTELDEKFKYFVGKKKEALQLSLPCSCKIRDVIPWNENGENPNGDIFFDELAHMLTVEFVRNGQYTVVPFPMKYLNEYIRFAEKDEEFGKG